VHRGGDQRVVVAGPVVREIIGAQGERGGLWRREQGAGGEGEDLDMIEGAGGIAVHVLCDHDLVVVPTHLREVAEEAAPLGGVEVVGREAVERVRILGDGQQEVAREARRRHDESPGDVVVGHDRVERQLRGLAEEGVQGGIGELRRPRRLAVDLDLRIDDFDHIIRTDSDVGVGRHIAVDRVEEVHPVEAADGRRTLRGIRQPGEERVLLELLEVGGQTRAHVAGVAPVIHRNGAPARIHGRRGRRGRARATRGALEFGQAGAQLLQVRLEVGEGHRRARADPVMRCLGHAGVHRSQSHGHQKILRRRGGHHAILEVLEFEPGALFNSVVPLGETVSRTTRGVAMRLLVRHDEIPFTCKDENITMVYLSKAPCPQHLVQGHEGVDICIRSSKTSKPARAGRLFSCCAFLVTSNSFDNTSHKGRYLSRRLIPGSITCENVDRFVSLTNHCRCPGQVSRRHPQSGVFQHTQNRKEPYKNGAYAAIRQAGPRPPRAKQRVALPSALWRQNRQDFPLVRRKRESLRREHDSLKRERPARHAGAHQFATFANS
jgi:hypothetical protein